MKRISIVIGILFSAIQLFSQEGAGALALPRVTQAPPDAFAFTRYGDIPIGLFTGSMNYSVPLFQVSSGRLSVPVSLEYTTNGVKVNDASGRTGVDWVLKAGGVITKTVVGRADQQVINPPPANATPTNADSVAFYNWLKHVADNDVNVQPDEYTYNFMGYVGKFFYDYQGTLRQLTPDGLKIVASNNLQDFKVTAPDGTQYFFRQRDQNFTYDLLGDNNEINSDNLNPTSWFLNKIKNIYNDSIVFNYDPTMATVLDAPPGFQTPDLVSGISQSMTVSPSEYYLSNPRYMPGSNCTFTFGELKDNSDDGGEGATCPGSIPEFRTSITMSSVAMTSMLAEIQFKTGKIRFFYSVRDDLPGEVKLDSMALVNKQNVLIKGIKLKYVYGNSNPAYTSVGFNVPGQDYLANVYPYLKKRLFLQSVNVSGKTGSVPSVTGFEYDDINGMPPRMSYAQDYWGYFNGRFNSDLMPGQNLFSGYYFLNSVQSGRSPDSAFSRKGTLKKINYPTGGYTEVKYEANQISQSTIHKVDTVNAVINYSGEANTTVYSPSFTPNFPMEINVSADWYAAPDPNGPQPTDPMVILTIENLTNPSQDLSFFTRYIGVGGFDRIYTNLHFLGQGNVYRLKLVASETYIKGKANFLHYKDTVNANFNAVSAGVRVASIKNYSAANRLENTKRFAYNKPGTPYSSGTGITRFLDNRDYCSKVPVLCTEGMVLFKHTVSSSSWLSGFKNDYASVNYEYATETFDSLGTNGSVTSRFLITENKLAETFACNPAWMVFNRSPLLNPSAPVSNFAHLNGKEVQKTVYKRVGTDTVKLKETNSYYSVDTALYRETGLYAVRKKITRPLYSFLWRYWADYDVNLYKRVTAWVHVDSVVDKTYEAAGQVYATKQVYKYGNSTHLQPTETYTFNSKGEMVTQRMRYPDDQRILTPSDPIINGMVNNNIIVAPIQQTSYVNSILQTTLQTDYNSSFYPAAVKKSILNNALQTEGEITQYDSYGNIQEVKEKDLYSSFVIDTSLNQIIAGVQNARVTDIAYTSFETGNKGGWSYNGTIAASTVPTGNNYFDLTTSNTLSKAVTSGKTYIVSYWRNNSAAFSIAGGTSAGYNTKAGPDGWYYHEHFITTNTTTIIISGTGRIDEVRLYPKGSLMTTYTFEPLIGMTSQCDPNNRIAYYEYDVLNRVSLIRDQDKNILKKFCYNYAGQPENCGVINYYSAAASGSFTRNNCGAGANAGTVTYSVPAGTYTSVISQSDADQKATNDVTTNGQAYANANAGCTWVNTVQSGSFTRNNCGAGGTGGTITYTINAGTYSSNISQASANQLAVNAVNAGGQAYANANAGCSWKNTAQSGSFTRNNCGAGATGGTVTYTIAANTYTSTISQADANQLAVNAVNAGGQAYANANAGCSWKNTAQSGNFTRNNCGAGGTGGTVTYTIAANTYTSTISQADANQQAINAVNAGGQAYANANAGCSWKNTAQSGNFTRNNCGAGGTGGTVTYTIAANTYTSTISQADANQQAVNAVNAGGQAHANANASCTWYNQTQSNSFQRNNCGTGGVGGTVTYTVNANTYSSNISQADANQLAFNVVNANGQSYANSNAGCTWYNQAMSQNFTRNNCPFGYAGTVVSYQVAASTYSSTVSLAAANQLAQNNINANGQSYANTNGNCTPIPCDSGNCGGENRKCVNGVCEIGYKVYTSSVWNESMNKYECTYHYEFSDYSWSQNYIEYSGGECPLF
ncbi:MAG: DUF5977 domain-containing protein [Chitinophagaceae bacterium]